MSQSPNPLQVVPGLSAILYKGFVCHFTETTETPTILTLQNKTVAQEAKVALLYGADGNNIVTMPPNDHKSVHLTYNFNGSTVIVANISDSDTEVSFLVTTQGSSNAQSQVDNDFGIAISPDTPVDKILKLVQYSGKFVIQILNKTQETLERVGSYNYLSNWPIGNIDSLGVVGQQFSGASVADYFSFASNYKIGNTGRFVQFSASWPFVLARKINLGVINASGNDPAKKAWDNMSNSDDKSQTNSPFSVKAFMTQKGNSVIWSYELSS